MSRRRHESSGIEEMFEMFREMPWFIGPIFAALVYSVCAWLVPWYAPPLKEGLDLKELSSGQLVLAPLSLAVTVAAPWLTGLVLLIWVAAQIVKQFDRQLVDQQHDHNNIRNLSWQEFEQLLCEAFRRQGYVVEPLGSSSGDGGIDIRLQRAGQVSLVQCKHWKTWQVGVVIVRELLGVVTSEKAHWGIIVTSGTFTADAIEFAGKNHIQLIDGNELLKLIRTVQSTQASRQESMSQTPSTIATSIKATCPTCGGPMTLRTARKGTHTGSQFYGCQKYPKCKGTRPV